MKQLLYFFGYWLTMTVLVPTGVWAQATLIKDIYPGQIGGIDTRWGDQRAVTIMNGILYFTANNSTQGEELWRSDGTEAGTYLVKDILPGSRTASSFPNSFFVHKNVLYFLANDGVNGQELWRSDGTAAGTTLLKDMRAGAGFSTIGKYAVINDEVQFWNSTTNELWKTNGTAAGTIKLVNLPGNGNAAVTPVVVRGIWYFQASGSELWRSDGTQAGTSLVKDM